MNTSLTFLLISLQETKEAQLFVEFDAIRNELHYRLDKEIHEAVSLYSEEYETWLDSLETQDQDKDDWINPSSVPFDGTIPF